MRQNGQAGHESASNQAGKRRPYPTLQATRSISTNTGRVRHFP
ncbi:hypothetical protein PSP6_690027 [Paraburkholderia tropica]|nr:hypothetical protein PSP6_690027 [Paraburkholderia tropica]